MSFPCEDGHAQERALLGVVLNTVSAGDMWIAGRNVCTRAFLCQMDTRGSFFAVRQHQGLLLEIVSPLQSYDRTPIGDIAQLRVCVVDEHGAKPVLRRVGSHWIMRPTMAPH